MSEKKQLFTKIWNSYFIRVFICAMLCQFTMAITNTVLPLYVINGLGMTAAQSGFLGTAFTIGSLIARVIAGYITDRFGRRTTMVVGALIVSVSLIMLGFQSTLIMLLVFKVTQGIGNSLHSTATNAAASETLPHESVGQGIGYYSLHTLITNAVGPTISLALMGVGAVAAAGGQNYKLALLAAGGMGILAMVIEITLNYENKLKAIDPSYGHKPTKIRLTDFVEIRAIVPAIMMFFTSFASGAFTYMIVFAEMKGFKSTSAYFIINAVIGVAIRFAFGNKLDRLRPRTVTLIAVLCNVVSYFALGITGSEAAFILSAFLMGAYMALLTPTFNAMAMKMCPKSRAGAASSTYWLGMDFGMAVGMIVIGYIIDIGGFSWAFNISGVYMAIFGVVAFIILRKTPPLVQIDNPPEDDE